MVYKYAVKHNGKWYEAGEEIPEAAAITDVDSATVEESSEVPEVVVSKNETTTGKRKSAKK